MAERLTIGNYIKNAIRGITPSDDALLTICADAGVESETLYADATKKQKDLSLAYFYKWIASPLLQKGGYTEENADWRSSETGERYSAAMLQKYLDMANEIFEEYDLPTVGGRRWKMRGFGFHYPRVKK